MIGFSAVLSCVPINDFKTQTNSETCRRTATLRPGVKDVPPRLLHKVSFLGLVLTDEGKFMRPQGARDNAKSLWGTEAQALP